MRIYSTTRASIVIGAQRHFGKALCALCPVLTILISGRHQSSA